MGKLLDRLGRFMAKLSGIDVDELCKEVELRKDSEHIPTVMVG